MFEAIKENIRGFMDVTIFITMIAIGMFTILQDFRYFRRAKLHRDADVSLKIGLACILLPFALLLITRL